MAKIRWRLVIGLASLGASLALTFPAVTAQQLTARVAEIWPNAVSTVADAWPNPMLPDDIWPNDSLFVDIQ